MRKRDARCDEVAVKETLVPPCRERASRAARETAEEREVGQRAEKGGLRSDTSDYQVVDSGEEALGECGDRRAVRAAVASEIPVSV
jgi:hypothetical protein